MKETNISDDVIAVDAHGNPLRPGDKVCIDVKREEHRFHGHGTIVSLFSLALRDDWIRVNGSNVPLVSHLTGSILSYPNQDIRKCAQRGLNY